MASRCTLLERNGRLAARRHDEHVVVVESVEEPEILPRHPPYVRFRRRRTRSRSPRHPGGRMTRAHASSQRPRDMRATPPRRRPSPRSDGRSCSLGGRVLPRPLSRRDALIELIDRELDEVAAREIFLRLPKLFRELGLQRRLGALHRSRRPGHALTVSREDGGCHENGDRNPAVTSTRP